jgi:hypothetical protein
MVNPAFYRSPCLLRDFKLDGAPGLHLNDPGPTLNISCLGDVGNPEPHQIASPKLAINRQVEHSQVSFPVFRLEPESNLPYLLQS